MGVHVASSASDSAFWTVEMNLERGPYPEQWGKNGLLVRMLAAI
jgi:hypothetical protein